MELKGIIATILFEGALKDLMEEVQMESLPKTSQDIQVVANVIIHQQF